MTSHRAVLLTDLVDSTRLNETLGDAAMGSLWEAHDGAARALMRSFRGREIARSDGFLVVFEAADDAVGFALAYHDALRRIDPRLEARVGLHVGPVALRENAELDKSRGAPVFEIDGIALPIAARVMGAARGGQTLLTASAVEGLDRRRRRCVSHGHWQLKGLAEPVELIEVGDAEAPFEPPADSTKAYRVVRHAGEWTPARKISNNLPAERDAFVGREEDLRHLAGHLDLSRLVTLVGIGGIGKTRLVLRHARTWLGSYPGGVWFCDLSTARDLEGVVRTVAQVLELPLGSGDAIEQIGLSIAARGTCLVVLDNFEQVARHAEDTLGRWLARAEDARFVATSREVLGIAGEQTQVLAPMLPRDGVELFVRRAAAAADRVFDHDAEADRIGELVRLLDGLPLAVELAAARSRVMSTPMLLERMSERFTLLTASRGRVDRQATLRAALDWSWDLLTNGERSALAQLSVFEGGFDLRALEAVLSPDAAGPRLAALDALQSLVDKSFVRHAADDRFDLLQTVQEYAAQQLRAGGTAAADAAEARHGRYYAAFAEEDILRSRSVELDNLAAACRRAARRGDASVAERTLTLAWAALELRGPFRLGIDLSDAVLAMAGGRAGASVHLVQGSALRAMGRAPEARSVFEAALGAARAKGDPVGEGEALCSLGNLGADTEQFDSARASLAAALELARASRHGVLECKVLNGLGNLNEKLGRTAAARADYEVALTLARRLKNRRWEGGVLANLGNLQYAQGLVAEAARSYEAGLANARELGNRKWEGNALCNLGLMRQLQGQPDVARQHLETALRVARELGHPRLEAIVLCNLGIVDEAAGRWDTACAHLESALAVAERLGDRRTQGQVLGYLGLLHSRRGAADIGRQHLERGKADLRAASNDIDLALIVCQSAEAHALLGEIEAARSELETAKGIANDQGHTSAFELAAALERVDRLLEASAVAAAPSPPIDRQQPKSKEARWS